ncbi:tetratricopeptide repeat protein [Rathayibacter toxicus]|nr:tetratricopeptide repeat protein [Rathayibacter toxicus]
MVVLLAFSLFLCLLYSMVAFAAASFPGVLLGVGLAILGAIGVWGLVRELVFGISAERLARRLEHEDALPQEMLSVRASGRPIHEDADALFPRYAQEVQAHPESWRAWYRLGLSYDASGDRKRAREAIRRSITLERESCDQSRA